jgi:hypothetical protein
MFFAPFAPSSIHLHGSSTVTLRRRLCTPHLVLLLRACPRMRMRAAVVQPQTQAQTSMSPPLLKKFPSTPFNHFSRPSPTPQRAAKRAQEEAPTSTSASGVAVERSSSAAIIWSTTSRHTLVSSPLRVRLSTNISINDSGECDSSFFGPVGLGLARLLCLGR